ncbi:UNVERIFIED_CONTAM: Glutamate receptor 3.5 [Sesamum radiatum]|uniref:Glutamate receptor 3.5 n=1 Tax=Sesamum radiatum TaxID=300843 RepID=A0AAW2KJ36_SESRA
MKAHVCTRRVLEFLVSCMWVAMGVMGRTGNSSAGSGNGPRVVNVGALFTFDSVIGKSAGPALLAAIEDVNSDTSILKDTKLNLISQDTNCSGFLGTVDGKGFFVF